MKTIEIIISPQGETRVETKGFTGAECCDASRFIEKALGENIAEQKTADFYLQEQRRQHNQQEL